MNNKGVSLAEGLYEKLTNDEDSRLCKDIDEDACRATPRSFALILCSYLFTKLGVRDRAQAVAAPIVRNNSRPVSLSVKPFIKFCF